MARIECEAVILTGGSSRRMGSDKSRILVEGLPLVERIARELFSLGVQVTVLGKEPIEGADFLADLPGQGGPAKALSRFEPRAPGVFVCACDLPLFQSNCVEPLVAALAKNEAAIPVVDGREQYLCAAYRSSAFTEWREAVESGGAQSMRELVRILDARYIQESELVGLGIDPSCVSGFNSADELERLLRNRQG